MKTLKSHVRTDDLMAAATGSVWRRGGTVAATLAVGVLLTWLATGPAAAAVPVHHLAESWNPLTGVKPDFTLFGPTLGQTWRRFIAAFWAACLAVCAMWMIAAGARMASANRRGFAGQQVEAKQGFLDAATAFGACAGASVIIAAILFVLGV